MTKAANDPYSAFFRLPDSEKWGHVQEALVEAGPGCRALADELKHAGGVWHTESLFDHARPKVSRLLALGWVYVKDRPNFDPMVDEGEIRLTPWGELLVALNTTDAFYR